ncbi:E3 ubiquitin-protein ligase parkin-like [Dreissena polymorpha]|uniref:E3 ubiquitin-protein ligase parkin-like n=1 Tax=Dreissena polymorpha TaxID=45954 RepID=UPI002263C901|nr:E3 ubiquitin-protein ligase parkin-like [Dreissena polymorpha]
MDLHVAFQIPTGGSPVEAPCAGMGASPILVYPCPDQHVVCIDCFKVYAQTSLDQRTFIEDQEVGYSLSCPVGCENSLIHDVHHFQLLGKDQYERYKDFGAEECLLKSGGIFCPNPGCGEGILVVEQARSVKCHTCRFEFCRQCSSAVDPGECSIERIAEETSGSQGIDTERALRSRWDAISLITIQQISKPCPHCGVKTERNGIYV